MPVGIQLAAPCRDEARLLAGAKLLEDILGLGQMTPIDPGGRETPRLKGHDMKRLAFLLAAMAFASPAHAFDCSKASSKVEKAICADDKLKAADDAMSKAYADVRNASRRQGEEVAGAVADANGSRAARINAAATEDAKLNHASSIRPRAAAASPRPNLKAAPGRRPCMVPVFIQQEGDRTHTDVDYTLIRFAKPVSKGEKAVQCEVDTIAKAAPSASEAEEAPRGHELHVLCRHVARLCLAER